eukprot:5961556-Pyramimonas_sp.AAC.1
MRLDPHAQCASIACTSHELAHIHNQSVMHLAAGPRTSFPCAFCAQLTTLNLPVEFQDVHLLARAVRRRYIL